MRAQRVRVVTGEGDRFVTPLGGDRFGSKTGCYPSSRMLPLKSRRLIMSASRETYACFLFPNQMCRNVCKRFGQGYLYLCWEARRLLDRDASFARRKISGLLIWRRFVPFFPLHTRFCPFRFVYMRKYGVPAHLKHTCLVDLNTFTSLSRHTFSLFI